MLNFYITKENVITKIDEFVSGCWINVVDPTEEELLYINKNF